MDYKDFVWFVLSEEDKGNDVSLDYWFRCIDLDDDGCLRRNEMLVSLFHPMLLLQAVILKIDTPVVLPLLPLEKEIRADEVYLSEAFYLQAVIPEDCTPL